ncbi:unnamed protein product, partial [Staurois parvus]
LAVIQCKTVNGFSKGASYKAGQAISWDSDHTWNMVYLEGRWHLLDTTWGAGHVDESISKFTFQYNEFYFLTHPALFIGEHYPEQADCQLLDPKVTRIDFQEIVHHKSHFYNLGLISSQPGAAVIETDKGKVSITIESRHKMLYIFSLNETEDQGLLRLMEHEARIDVYPSKTGQQIIQIYAKRQDLEEAYQLVMDYRIDCKTVDNKMKIPKCLHNPAGPSWLSEMSGLLHPSHPGPTIHTEDGCCIVSFALMRDLSIFPTLHSDDVKMMPEMEHRHIFQTKTQGNVQIKVRLPQSGTYVLHVNIMPKNSNMYKHQCNYLITCTNTAVKWPVFPLVYTDWSESYELVQPLEGILSKDSDVFFKLQIPDVAGVCVKGKDSFPLDLNESGYWEGTCSTANCKYMYVSIRSKDNPDTRTFILQYHIGDRTQ